MSNLSFLGHMGINKMGQIGDILTQALVNFDPETASATQIAEYANHCDDIAHRVAKAESDVNTANTKVGELQVKLDRDRVAAKLLREQIAATTDQTRITTLTTQANAIIAQMKQIGGDTAPFDGSIAGDLFDAKNDLIQAQSDLTEWRNVHAQAVQQLTTAQATLKHARDDMARAQHEANRAKARQQQAEADANLRGGTLNQGAGVAISAMAANAAKMRENARAATIQADALHSAKGGDADAIVAATLASTKPSSSSVLDDLNSL